ncbi:unnamed protein product [Adineta ricciae]|uniref:HTH CENPB-type domain-containing protein n=1 Tax=Adineta ricciae TaxID=249248 RepID=A0A815I9U8_ADIRI|nr:unnamed protein product [Adineta ricciae]CAF1426222.1 unnamed protein product [Adineta ricciae]
MTLYLTVSSFGFGFESFEITSRPKSYQNQYQNWQNLIKAYTAKPKLNQNLILKTEEKHPEPTKDEPSSKDYELADQLFLLFNELLTSAKLLVDHIVTLDFNEYGDCSADYQEEEDDNAVALNVDGITYSYDTMCPIVEFSKTHTFPTFRRRYRQIKYKEQLRRIKRYVNAQDMKTQKLQFVDNFVYTEFIRARECCLPMHDSDLRRLAIRKAHNLYLVGFMASSHWILDFKRRHHISSRKVTKLVTKNHLEDRNEILKSAERFVKTVKNTISDYAEDHI